MGINLNIKEDGEKFTTDIHVRNPPHTDAILTIGHTFNNGNVSDKDVLDDVRGRVEIEDHDGKVATVDIDLQADTYTVHMCTVE